MPISLNISPVSGVEVANITTHTQSISLAPGSDRKCILVVALEHGSVVFDGIPTFDGNTMVEPSGSGSPAKVPPETSGVISRLYYYDIPNTDSTGSKQITINTVGGLSALAWSVWVLNGAAHGPLEDIQSDTDAATTDILTTTLTNSVSSYCGAVVHNGSISAVGSWTSDFTQWTDVTSVTTLRMWAASSQNKANAVATWDQTTTIGNKTLISWAAAPYVPPRGVTSIWSNTGTTPIIFSVGSLYQNKSLAGPFPHPGHITNGLRLFIDPGNTNCYPGSGTDVFDLSGDRNDGQFTGSISYSSNDGGTWVLDGNGDHIDFGPVASSSMGVKVNDFSVCGFGKLGTVGSKLHTMYGIYASGTGKLHQLLRVDNGTMNVYTINNAGGTYGPASYNTTTNPPALTTTQWYYFAYTVSPYTGTVNIKRYLDDRPEQSTTVNVTNYTPTGEGTVVPIRIGGNAFATNETWSGSLGPVLVYDRELSRAEILQNFDTFRGRYGI